MFLENFKFFKTPRNKQFNYKPLYWDEEKEDLKKRVAAAEKEALGEENYSREALKERMDFRSQGKHIRRPDFMTNIRVLFIAGLLALVVYFVYWYL